MNNEKFSADMTPEERHRKLIEMPDDDIDYSDIPPLTDEFWKNAEDAPTGLEGGSLVLCII